MKETIEELLLRHEGLRFTPYQDTLGYWTIGVGRCISTKGITKEEALYLLNNDIEECKRDLVGNIFKGDFHTFPEPVQLVLVSMRFQLGPAGFRQFKKMITAFKAKDYDEAIVQMKDSSWYKQTTNRANDLIKMILEAK
jgi:lysozyme